MKRHALQTNRVGNRRKCRGIALAWTALVLIVMIGMVGLSIDWGKLVWNAHQMQNAADAAALAGAMVVKQDPAGAIQRTHDLGLANSADQKPVTLRTTAQPTTPFTGDDPSLDIVLGRWVNSTRTFIATLDAPNAVKAVVRRNAALGDDAPPLAMVFGPIFGTDSVDAQREAIAWCRDSGGSGLICLSSSVAPGLYLSGTADLDVDNGGIHVNSTFYGDNKNAASCISGNAALDCGFLNVVGGIDPAPDSSEWLDIFADTEAGGFSVVDGTIPPGPQHIDDPLASAMQEAGEAYVLYTEPPEPYAAHLDVPTLVGGTTPLIPTYNIPTVTTSTTLAPGYYPNGLSITNGVTVTLAPTSTSGLGTLFVFGGGTGKAQSLGTGLTVNGGTLTGHGVTCYVTENLSTHVLGVTDWGAGAVVDLWSPGDWMNKDATTPNLDLVQGINGVAVWQDPTMKDKKGFAPEVHLNGSPSGDIHGTLYFPDPIHVFLNGDLGQMGNQILCGSATIEGTATISVNYDGRNTPGASHQSFLVE